LANPVPTFQEISPSARFFPAAALAFYCYFGCPPRSWQPFSSSLQCLQIALVAPSASYTAFCVLE